MQGLSRKTNSRIIELSEPQPIEKDKRTSHQLQSPPSIAPQYGWDCETCSLSSVMQWLYDNESIQKKPLPQRKRNLTAIGLPANEGSLRRRLKQYHPSSVGVTHNPETLLNVVTESHEELVATCFECQNRDAYCQVLMDAIDNQLAPIIFYNANGELHPTTKKEGNTGEHATVVIGYTQSTDGELSFITQHQSGKTKITIKMNATQLFKAASSLPSETMRPVTYTKIQKMNTDKKATLWVPEKVSKCFTNTQNMAIRTQHAQDTVQHGGLKNKIILIDSKHRIDALIQKLEKKINKSRFFCFNTPLDNAKKRALSQLKTELESNRNKDVLYALIEEWKREKNSHGQNHWEVIRQHHFPRWLSFFNPKKTESETLIEETLKTMPRLDHST